MAQVSLQPVQQCRAGRFLVAGLIVSPLAMLATTAVAAAPDWIISEATQGVTLVHQGIARPATRNSHVEAGDAIVTSANARAVIVHGEEFAVIAPQSRLEIKAAVQGGAMTRLMQSMGNAVFTLRKRLEPYFAVDTPYLAAVVKGTTFSVTVDSKGASVQVIEGAVEVSTNAGSARQLVLPGDVAIVHAFNPQALSIAGGHSVMLGPAPASKADAVPSASSVTEAGGGQSGSGAQSPTMPAAPAGATGPAASMDQSTTKQSETVAIPATSDSSVGQTSNSTAATGTSTTVAETSDKSVSLASATQGLVTDSAVSGGNDTTANRSGLNGTGSQSSSASRSASQGDASANTSHGSGAGDGQGKSGSGQIAGNGNGNGNGNGWTAGDSGNSNSTHAAGAGSTPSSTSVTTPGKAWTSFATGGSSHGSGTSNNGNNGSHVTSGGNGTNGGSGGSNNSGNGRGSNTSTSGSATGGRRGG